MHPQKNSPGDLTLKSKPWITFKITKMIKARNKLFARRKRQPETIMLLKFSRSSEIKLIERSLIQKNIICSNNVKKTWQGIKAIINIKNPTAPD